MIEADPAEVPVIAGVPGVAAVEPDEVYELTTDASHDLIGSAAIWDGETGPELPTRGEGVVVGILDSGINAFHPSFAATDGEGYTHTNPYGAHLGVCDPTHPNHDPICNDKLVGAYEFVSGNSARDTNGHGSHTASTAAGNRHDVTLTYGPDTFTRTVQGVAPRANLIAYRVCIDTCPVTAILAGINQAVADGVDVLNYSISGADSPWADSVSRAFLEAFGAGIFVATSAGNSGPGAGTVAHTAPWNASVAATNSDRTFAKILSVLGPAPVPPELTAIPGWPGFGPGNATPIEAELRYSDDVGSETGCTAVPRRRVRRGDRPHPDRQLRCRRSRSPTRRTPAPRQRCCSNANQARRCSWPGSRARRSPPSASPRCPARRCSSPSRRHRSR